MAIINAKRIEADEEADRQARLQAEEYAHRHDTAWQQPPPAYEEAAQSQASSAGPPTVANDQPVAGSSSHPQQPGNEGNERYQRDERQQARRASRSKRSARQAMPDVEGGGQDESDDESMPLLTRRQKIMLKKKLRYHDKYRRACRILGAFLLTGILTLLMVNLFGHTSVSSEKPAPWASDGHPVESPVWSEPVETSPETWISPSIPAYSSEAWFVFPADLAKLFVRAHGSSYTGLVIFGAADEVSEERWKEITHGHFYDRAAILVESRFTHKGLRDLVRVNKMRNDDEKHVVEGLAIYADALPTTGTSYVAFSITVYFPPASRRTLSGLAHDGTSWIPHVQVEVDNLRIAHEGGFAPDKDPQTRFSYGKLDLYSHNGGITISSSILANESVTMKVDSGHIRDIEFRVPRMFAIAAPVVDLVTANGPIWLSGIVGSDAVTLHTGTGGINISSLAVARVVSSTNNAGVLGGSYAALDELNIASKSGDVAVDVRLAREAYSKMLKSSGLLALLGRDSKEQLAEMDKLNNPWRKCRVNARNTVGPILVQYHDHGPETELDSIVTSASGSLQVIHHSGFEGSFELRTAIGTITIGEPGYENKSASVKDDVVAAPPHKVFVIDQEERWRIGEKVIKGRLWSGDHKWEDGGSGHQTLFPISKSVVNSEVGAIQATFA